MIGTGYYEKDESSYLFYKKWANLISKTAPEQSVTVLTHGSRCPYEHSRMSIIRGVNLGHVGEYIHSARQGRLCGWSASVLALALAAYNMGEDLVYVEQDCLCFGSWYEQAYKDLGDGEFIFGKKHESAPFMPCSQSLFIIRNSFLLEFVRVYLSLPEDAKMLPEDKFCEIEKLFPEKCRRLSFGVDRERPIPWDAPVFYVQQWTDAELQEARNRNLIR